MNIPTHHMLRIFWKSPCDAGDVIDKQILGVRWVFDQEHPDVQVLDIREFDDIDHLFESRPTRRAPSLIVVREQNELMAALEHAEERDEICYGDDFPEAATYYLMRLICRLYPDGRPVRNTPAATDPLTGLPLRKDITATYERYLKASDAAHPVSVLLLDLDHFKGLNDSFGHAAGDNVLAAIGGLLSMHAGERIFCSRWGGDEFVILIKADHSEALGFANFLRGEIKKIEVKAPDLDVPSDFQVTASFGISTSYEDTDFEKAVKQADINLYKAKMAGRDKVRSTFLGDKNIMEDQRNDLIIRDFENRIRVTADRLVEYINIRGRRMVDYYREEANRDGLTGLYNHRYFEQRLAREIENSKKENRPLSLLFLDVDNFGAVNRQYGYPTGDVALRYTVGIINASVRSVDWVARYGGEEFCVIMPVTPLNEAILVAERIRQKISEGEVVAHDGRRLTLTVSVGVAQFNQHDKMIDFIQHASDKTREAKRAGKNSIRY